MEIDAPVTMRDSVVARNAVTVQGQGGALAFGGGIAMFGGDLTLERTVVVANAVSATAPLRRFRSSAASARRRDL